ncbi:hypothetical protein ANTRET_LOCUS4374 [Anthophora retusa]
MYVKTIAKWPLSPIDIAEELVNTIAAALHVFASFILTFLLQLAKGLDDVHASERLSDKLWTRCRLSVSAKCAGFFRHEI